MFWLVRSLAPLKDQIGYRAGTDGLTDERTAIQKADERLQGFQSNQDADARADGGVWMDE